MGPLRNHCNNPRAILVALGGDFSLIRSGDLLPPSPPAEKATARGQEASTDDGSRRLALRMDDCALLIPAAGDFPRSTTHLALAGVQPAREALIIIGSVQMGPNSVAARIRRA
jgi:hypothetical protein